MGFKVKREDSPILYIRGIRKLVDSKTISLATLTKSISQIQVKFFMPKILGILKQILKNTLLTKMSCGTSFFKK